jgi:hypothetical protein
MKEAENASWDLENLENCRKAAKFFVMTFAYRSICGLFYDQTADLTELLL